MIVDIDDTVPHRRANHSGARLPDFALLVDYATSSGARARAFAVPALRQLAVAHLHDLMARLFSARLMRFTSWPGAEALGLPGCGR